MGKSSKQTHKILKNTILLYLRMLFLMVVTLYTSRVILDALGVEDYGIYNVVGGFVGMFALISSSLTSACSRFLNYELGKGNLQRQNLVFSTAVSIQWGLAIIVAVLSEIIGGWYVNNIMVLPADRLVAANWCFQFSVFNFCMNLVTVPYNASIIAHERMGTFAYIGLFQGLAQLGISFLIYWEPFDRLVFYALLLMLLQFGIRYYYQYYCRKHFPECRYKFVIDKAQLKELLSYSLWHLIGNGAGVLKSHGVNLVLNLFFGPIVNAARGVATQLDSAINQFVSNFMMALNPQITQSYAKEDHAYMLKLVNKGACFCFYLILFFSLPIIINANFIMHLWLKEVPPYAVVFSQLTFISMMIMSISRPLITAQNATGNVRDYQLVVGGINLLNLPFSYIALYWGMEPTSVEVIAIIVNLLALVARVYMLPLTVKHFNRSTFIRHVAFKCLIVALISSIMPVAVSFLLDENFVSFVINVLLCVLMSLITILYVGCSKTERDFAFNKLREVRSNIIKL